MSSHLNLAALTEAKLAFVTRLSTATLQTLVAELGLEKQLELGDDLAASKAATPWWTRAAAPVGSFTTHTTTTPITR